MIKEVHSIDSRIAVSGLFPIGVTKEKALPRGCGAGGAGTTPPDGGRTTKETNKSIIPPS